MRKENRTYYFSVEGETEHWYLSWLQKTINASPEAKYKVKLDSKVEKNPVSRVKRMTILGKTHITHMIDVESLEPIHVKQFGTALDQMRAAENTGKNIEYHLGYSNFTFELWMILHMADCNGTLTYRQQYLTHLNRAYGVNFENLKQYKEEKNFQKMLDKLSLDHVRQAIRRSKVIMKRCEEKGFKPRQYRKYMYYEENPSLSVWEQIEKILQDCEIL